jgi:hypothetical protein
MVVTSLYEIGKRCEGIRANRYGGKITPRLRPVPSLKKRVGLPVCLALFSCMYRINKFCGRRFGLTLPSFVKRVAPQGRVIFPAAAVPLTFPLEIRGLLIFLYFPAEGGEIHAMFAEVKQFD